MMAFDTDYNDVFQELISANTDIQAIKRGLKSALERLTASEAELAAINTKYAAVFVEITEVLAGDPTNEQWLALKNQAQGIKGARDAALSELQAINAAIAAA